MSKGMYITLVRQHIAVLWTQGQNAYACIVRIICVEAEEIEVPAKVSMLKNTLLIEMFACGSTYTLSLCILSCVLSCAWRFPL